MIEMVKARGVSDDEVAVEWRVSEQSYLREKCLLPILTCCEFINIWILVL